MTALRAKTGAEAAGSRRPSAWAVPRQPLLRNVLAAGDVVAVAGTWSVALGSTGSDQAGTAAPLGVAVLVITAATLAFMAGQQLYLARVCRVRAVEVSRLVRTAAVSAVAVHVFGPRWGISPSVARTAATAGALALALTAMRGAYGLWLRRHRSSGRYQRPAVVVGSRDEAEGIQRLIQAHPELGLEAVATVGPAADLMTTLEDHRADTVVVAAGAFPSADLNRVTRRLLDSGVHVHLSTGLTGIDQRRLRPQPMAREPMFYLEPIRISAWRAAAKRSLDVVGSAVGLVMALPVLVLAAAAIKLEDRGPVLYRHRRVGQHGEEFTILKLRTMVPDAERQLHLLADSNERTGPLFKCHRDPRVTRVGRLLRATSVDELPQLVNVLLGSMSLVGPRPALADEVAHFDAELRSRERVRPGLTGLWQIEGRDDPSFAAYRRLDLFYVENWTLELDLVILVSTAKAVVVQAVRELRRQWRSSHALPTTKVLDLAASAELAK